MAAVAEQRPRRWTYEEYYRLDDEQRYEIIDGELLMAPAPDYWHQDWAKKLFRRIDGYVMDKQLGEVFFAPFDIILDAENVVQPDLLFIAKANLSILQTRGVFGAPDLLVELISPSSVQRDRYVKKALYARFGIKEYWIVDPEGEGVETYVYQDSSLKKMATLKPGDEAQSRQIPGFSLKVADVFA